MQESVVQMEAGIMVCYCCMDNILYKIKHQKSIYIMYMKNICKSQTWKKKNMYKSFSFFFKNA